jgi:hypothetical protein
MKTYFKNHPLINYNGQTVRNLMLSAKLTKEVLGDTTSFLPYTVQEGETPTTIAFDYYGHVDYTWLVLFSNSMTDSYNDWVKTQEQFNAFILKEYNSIESTYSTIYRYKHNTDSDMPLVTVTSYAYMTPVEKGEYSPVYLYDWLHEMNEAKRKIKLVDKAYAPRIALELEKKLRQ